MKSIPIIISLIICLHVFNIDARPLTSDDLRDAVMSLANVIKQGTDKLERHEKRELQVGETLKKMLVVIEKKQRSMEPMKGTLSRLDERLANVETILLQKDERERIQLQKTTNAIEEINNSLKTWMASMEKILVESSKPTPEPPKVDTLSKDDLQALKHEIFMKVDNVLTKDDSILTKTDNIITKVDKLNGEIGKIQEDSKNIKQHNERSAKNLDHVEGQLKNSEQLLEKYENHLAELSNRILPVEVQAAPPENNNWQSNFLTALESQKSQLVKISDDIKMFDTKLWKLPDSNELTRNHNITLETLHEMRYEYGSKCDKSAYKLDARLAEIEKKLNQNQEELMKTVTDIGEVSEHGLLDIAKGNEQLRHEVQAIGKMEKVMLQTADNVLDTKRRIEYGVHQILLEVGDLVKLQSNGLNTTMNNRFDNIELTILDNQTGALANLSSKLEQEMSQVWRQIGIMYQELTASTSALDKLQAQTMTYVNGSMNTMDSMESKVGQITSRMMEVDQNLNYLLGRLGLITQEFNRIKDGFGDALDNIRLSYRTVKDKLADLGPGPHKIDDAVSQP